MSETWYDKEADVIGIQLKNKRHWKGVEISKHVIVDLAKDGEIVGIEILGAKEAFKKDTPLIVSKSSGTLTTRTASRTKKPYNL